VVICQLVAARRALRAADVGRRERMGNASVALEGRKASLDLGACARDVGLDGSHVDCTALVCETRAFGETDSELVLVDRRVDGGARDKEREYGKDKGGGELHGVDARGERKRGRDDEGSSVLVRAAYICPEPMHSLPRSMRSDRLKPVQLHRLPRIGVGTSTGCDDRGTPKCSQAILCTLSE
jgi:hypothetical protein